MSASEAEEAKVELAKCETEISNLKTLLRSLGPAGHAGDEGDESNHLVVTWIKVSFYRTFWRRYNRSIIH